MIDTIQLGPPAIAEQRPRASAVQARAELDYDLARFAGGQPFESWELGSAARRAGRDAVWLRTRLREKVDAGLLAYDRDACAYRVIDRARVRVAAVVAETHLLVDTETDDEEIPAGACELCGGPYFHGGVIGHEAVRYCSVACAEDDRAEPAEGLTGVAELTRELSRAAGTSSVLVTVAPDGQTGAWSYAAPCTGVARIEVGAELLQHPHQVRLAGALAHEVAHEALGHTGRTSSWWDARVVFAITVVAAAVGSPWWILPVGLVAATVLHLIDLMGQRREEFAADAYSVELLDAAGLPGREIVTTTLEQVPDDGRWYRTLGWIIGSYPTQQDGRIPAWLSDQERPRGTRPQPHPIKNGALP
ncbi:M48 family metalloprotease [Streptosporangium roseum]|uniref:M48 family metalloprotease n=1 Tax=Streptosporangium roseum TaxID=2001 RepID=UPI0004CD6DFA|nr:M48 family metalloprotease [Streptosporangium roseum]